MNMRALIVIALLAASPAAAQRFDSNAPIDVDAGRIDIADDANEAIFSGAVVIRQGSMTLNADRVRITYSKDNAGSPQVQRLDALGSVRLRQDTMRATSNSGVYDVNRKLVTLIGNVKLDRGTDHLEGARVVWNLATRTTSFDARTASNPGGRVTGRFTVPQKKQP
ncbi:lipopolysaccharide transport periplasmic protein LptA [Sandarakinorhabdus limnophila]|jgi:lipopolysaccharide export system protein LptA|uniref:lipopolysaccharide transport periplasmic protein LptA n=2 Tax=Sandarakinorhabdus limnophila TaxID=210512 RepID=UPI0003B326F2|nr:lipopolysaccharide transport periplasmic protein LptA [Sandarakinorhabdus limnophila]